LIVTSTSTFQNLRIDDTLYFGNTTPNSLSYPFNFNGMEFWDDTGAKSDLTQRVGGGGYGVYNILLQNGALGTPAIVNNNQTAGAFVIGGYDGSNFGTLSEIQTQVDGTPGAGDLPGRLVFMTTPDGAATSTEKMRINNFGNVLIGTTTGQARLFVSGTSSTSTNIFAVASSSGTLNLFVSGTGNGTTTVTGLSIVGSATSTSNVGFNLTAGCYAINGVCIGDNPSQVNVTNGTITNSTSTNFNTNLLVAATSSITNLNVLTNLFANVFNAISATITTLWGTTANFAVLNASTTNATTTNAITANFTNVFATTSSSTNVNSLYFFANNATITNATLTSATATNIVSTNASTSNLLVTNATVTRLRVTGQTELGAQSVANLAGGGDIGTAAATVDVGTVFNVDQTTANQTLTIPNPTDTVAGKIIYINNVGTVKFIVSGSQVEPGEGRQFIWNGTTWTNIFWNPGSGTQVKTASTTQTVTNSTALVNHNELSFSIGANETIVFQYTLRVTNANSATPDWKSAILAPAGSTCSVTLSGEEPAAAAFPQANTTNCTTPGTLINATILADANVPFNVYINGFVTSGGTAGSVNLQFAENTAGAGTSISVLAGSYLQAFQTTGADLAEVYYTDDTSIYNGDVVAVDGTGISQVVKADREKSSSALGVISTKPGIVLGEVDATGKPVIVGLAGRVPVKVTNENGDINVGDYLAVSDIPGFAMKATDPGQVIGQALTSFVSSTTNATGTVVVFIKNTYYDGIDLIQSTTTATSTVLESGSIADRFTHFVRSSIEKLTNVFLDMTLWIRNVKSERIETKIFCLEDVCINKYDLQGLLENKNAAQTETIIIPPTETSTNPVTTDNSTTTTVVEDMTGDNTQTATSTETVPENGTTTEPTPTPDPSPAPEPTPEPIPQN
jgi:hypothetical protein